MPTPPRKPDPRALLEELEPRLLMSADAAGVLLGPDLAESGAEEPTAHRALLDSADSRTLAETDVRRELAFVDPSVEGWEELVDDLRARSDAKLSLEILVLDPDRDGIEEIAAALEDFEDLDAIHVISHGRDGALQLGSGWLTIDTLESRPGVLASWGDALASDGDLLFYGCDLAGGESGVALVDRVARLTGADVAASVDVTGSALLGGDWELEHRTGAVETASALSAEGQWQGRLAIVTGHETANAEVEIWSDDGAWGQSFTYTSGDGSYAVDSVSLQLRDNNSAPGQVVTVSIRPFWDGAVLASDSVVGNTLPSSLSWHDFDMGGVSLTDGQSYVIQVEASTPSGKVYMAYDDAGGYAGGERFDDPGVAVAGDLSFRVSTLGAVVAPVLGGIEGSALDYTENDGAVAITDSVTAGSSSGNVLGAVVSITGNFASGEDVLGFTDTATISGTWDGAGTLTLIGTDTAAAYEAALRNVTYENSSETPSELTRQVSIAVTNGAGFSNVLVRNIDVTAVNDAPSLAVSNVVTTLAEDTSTASRIKLADLAINDVDGGANGLGLIGADATSFEISGGALYLKAGTSLDYETKQTYSVVVQLEDPGAGSSPDDEFTLTLSITDVNEAAPVASGGPFTIDENASDGAPVGTVSASDADTADQLQFAIIGGNTGGAFEIDADTGAITVKDSAALDFGTIPTYDLQVQVTDDGTPPRSSTTTVRVNLTDSNTAPVIADQGLAVDENAADGTVVGTVVASDPDVSAGGLAYLGFGEAKATSGGSTSLTIPTPAGTSSGDLLMAVIALDNSHALSLNPPPGEGWSFELAAENGGRVTLIVFTKTVDPGESASHQFTWSSGDQAYGWIMGFSGQDATDPVGSFQVWGGDSSAPIAPSVTTTAPDAMILRIGAFRQDDIIVDQPGLDTHVPITMDEAGAVSGGAGYEIQTAPGSSGTATFDLTNSRTWLAATIAIQPDATASTDVLSYAITAGNADGAFAIDASTGEITVADGSLLDTEAAASRTLTVEVTDSQGASDDASVTIDIRNVNEAPSVSGGPFTLAENASDSDVVGSVTGSDPDVGDTLRYAIVGGDPAGVFAIDDVTGEISVADASLLDFDTTPSFDLAVEVRDGGTPALTGSTTVRVDLTNVNEAPSVSGGPFTLAENASDSDVVGSVTGSDPDAGDTLRYAIVGGDPAGVFAIDDVTGEISVADASLLDFDTTPSFDLVVEVRDGGTPALTGSTTVRVDLTNVNEAPTASGGPFDIAEGSPDDTVVGSVSASDPDAGTTLRYTIVGGDPGGVFAIDAASGEISVADGSLLDFETTPSFDLRVEVRDDGTPALSAFTQVIVNVTNTNDAPTVTGGPFTLAEDSSDGTVVGSVTGNDTDAGDSLRYAIVGGDPNGVFRIDVVSGEITVADGSLLDFDTAPSFDLQVQVSDDGSPPLSGTATVRVDLTGVNEAPSLSSGPLSIAEGSADGTLVGIVAASDPDAGDTLRFQIVGGNPARTFAIDATSGAITVLDGAQLDFESRPTFDLRVRVTDGGTPPLSDTITVRIDVADANEAPTASSYAYFLFEGSPTGSSAGAVQGSDPDAGDVLQYAIVGGNTGNAFAIDPDTGEITVNDPTAIDFDTNPLFVLQIQVSDDGNPVLSGSVDVLVFVRDISETVIPSDDEDPPGTETETPAGDPAEEDPGEEIPAIDAVDTTVTETDFIDRDDGRETASRFTASLHAIEPQPEQPERPIQTEEGRRDTRPWDIPEQLGHLATDLPLVDQVFAQLRQDFLGDLERVRNDVVAPEGFETAVAGSSLSLAAGLSVGYALLLTRGGLLLASLVSSMPAWRLIDPLPVLSSLAAAGDGEGQPGGQESLGSMVRGERPDP